MALVKPGIPAPGGMLAALTKGVCQQNQNQQGKDQHDGAFHRGTVQIKNNGDACKESNYTAHDKNVEEFVLFLKMAQPFGEEKREELSEKILHKSIHLSC